MWLVFLICIIVYDRTGVWLGKSGICHRVCIKNQTEVDVCVYVCAAFSGINCPHIQNTKLSRARTVTSQRHHMMMWLPRLPESVPLISLSLFSQPPCDPTFIGAFSIIYKMWVPLRIVTESLISILNKKITFSFYSKLCGPRSYWSNIGDTRSTIFHWFSFIWKGLEYSLYSKCAL